VGVVVSVALFFIVVMGMGTGMGMLLLLVELWKSSTEFGLVVSLLYVFVFVEVGGVGAVKDDLIVVVVVSSGNGGFHVLLLRLLFEWLALLVVGIRDCCCNFS